MVLKVREDVEQPYKNGLIFSNIYRSKDTGRFNFKIFNTIGKACDMENGKEYASLTELLEDFRGRSCKVRLGHNEYNDKVFERVEAWKSSDFPKAKDLSVLYTETKLTEDDIPF